MRARQPIVYATVLTLIGCAKEAPVAIAPESPPRADASPIPTATSTPTATPTASASASASATASAPPPVPSVMPTLDLSCSVDADCGTSQYGGDCCPQCKPAFGNKTSLAKRDAYCSTQKVKCPSGPCSWASGPSRCVAGKCADPSKP